MDCIDLANIKDWSRITEVERVYCAVRIESLYKTEKFLF
jgi:hypothetical protein